MNVVQTKKIGGRDLAPNDPHILAARAAYTEVALGMRPNYDRLRRQHEANNYEYVRLACRQHILAHGSLPTWKPGTKLPEWLAIALSQNRRDFGSYF
jgi:hypothetical protein